MTEHTYEPRPPVLYTIPEAADRLRIARTTAYGLIEKGHLQRVKIGKRALIPATSIDAYIASLSEGGDAA